MAIRINLFITTKDFLLSLATIHVCLVHGCIQSMWNIAIIWQIFFGKNNYKNTKIANDVLKMFNNQFCGEVADL